MDKRPTRQRGMTLIGFLLMFALIGFSTLLIVKLSPIYLEHYKIKSILKNLEADTQIADKSTKEITEIIQKRWNMNSIGRISAENNLFYERQGQSLKIQVEYEVEEHLLGNVSVLVKFDDSITVGNSN